MKKTSIRMSSINMIEGLYAITPDCTDTADLLRRARLALAGGAGVLQYRNKSVNAVLRLIQATALRQLTCEFAVPFIVNDDVHLAAQVEALERLAQREITGGAG